MEEAFLSNRRTQIPDSRNRLGRQMDQRVAHQSQAKVPLLLTQVVKQLFMHKAAISKQSNHQTRRHDGAHLLQNWLIVLKTNLGAFVAHSPPGQGDGTTSVNERGTDQDKGSQSRRVQGNRHTGVSRPIMECYLQDRAIPLLRMDGWMMQQPGEAALTASSRFGAALQHLGPCAQSDRVGQAHTSDRPGQCAQAANILVSRSRDDGQQCIQEFVMYLLGFVHGDTSMNPYTRSSTLIPFPSTLILF